MSEPQRSAAAALSDEIGSLAADVKESAALRWELARLELRSAATQIKRLAIGLAAAGVLLLGCVPILAVALAAWLAEHTIVSFAGWSAMLGVAFLLTGATGGYVAWRGFRRRFIGMEETLEELHEDLLWLREWTGRQEESPKS